MTTEIAIYPENSQFDRGDFLWRISNARIEADNQFSQFSGFDRKLALLEGEGLVLNVYTLAPLQVYTFPGEEKIQCQLKGKIVEDFGVIFKRDDCNCEMTIQKIETSLNWDLKKGTHFLIPLNNPIQYNQTRLVKGEFVKAQDIEKLSIAPFQNKFAHVLLVSVG